MKKKVLASLLLAVLIASNLMSPLAYALDNTGNSSAPTTVVEQNSQTQEQEIEIVLQDKATQAKIAGASLELTKKDTGEKVAEWASATEAEKVALVAETSYLLKVADMEGYESTSDMTIKVDAEGNVYIFDKDDWQKQKDAKKLTVDLTAQSQSEPAEVTEAEEADAEDKVDDKDAVKTLTVTVPEINVYNVDDGSDEGYPASFKLRKEGETEELASWSSSDGSPTVSIEVGAIYELEEYAVYNFNDLETPIKLRITADGKFEQADGDDWKTVDIIKVPIKKTKKLRRAARALGIDNPITVAEGDIAPFNRLQIVKDMPRSSGVTLIGWGSQYDTSARVSGGSQDQDHNKLHDGEYRIDSRGYGIDPNIKKGFDDDPRGAVAIRFKPSNTWASGYQSNPNAGWNTADLSLDTTNMWVKVKYTDAAYYDGQLVDAIATIKVTPYKNRTIDTNNATLFYANAQYYPVIEIGDLLTSGWTWQNVNKFQVDLEFYSKNGELITFPNGDLNSKDAAYYTVNSLDPKREPTWENPAAAYGPESVVPAPGTTSGAYVIPGTNIETSYNEGPNGVQNAYNGGSTGWGTVLRRQDIDDVPGSATWSKNSVLFTTAETSHITVTLGNLERNPVNQRVPRTNYIWATLSTEAFTTNLVKYIDIPIQKTWSDPENSHDAVTIDLYATWTENGQKKDTLIQSQELSSGNNWSTVFKQVPDQDSLEKIIKKNFSQNARNIKYEVREREIPTNYDASYSGNSSSGTGFTVTNKKVKSSLTITKSWLDKGNPMGNEATKDFAKIKVTLKRKVGNTEDTSFKQEIELAYNADASLSWKTTVDNLPINNDSGKAYTYYIEEDITTIPDNFYIKAYLNGGIQLKANVADNQLGVTNERQESTLTIRKLWYKNDGETQIANTDLPEHVKVKLYRTTNGSTTGGDLYKEITLTRRAEGDTYVWTTNEVVPVRDKTGKTFYTYYIEEEQIRGYLEISDANGKSVAFTSSSIQDGATLTLKNKVNPTYPATGGFGILPYLSIGILSLFTAVILYYMQNRKEIRRADK